MKFRTISRLIYLKRARHRHGHSIHSPFLFYLVTKVIENKSKQPEYAIFKTLKTNTLILLDKLSEQSLLPVYHQFSIRHSKTRKLYKKVELPLRYGKVIFQLIREFQPSTIVSYGPALGTNLTLMAMANNKNFVYQVVDNSSCELLCKELLKETAISNIQFVSDHSMLKDNPDFVMINFSNKPDETLIAANQYLKVHGDDGVLIIKGIHESKEMETIWQTITLNESVRVTLDLFEIGIALFRNGLQKENFVLKY